MHKILICDFYNFLLYGNKGITKSIVLYSDTRFADRADELRTETMRKRDKVRC